MGLLCNGSSGWKSLFQVREGKEMLITFRETMKQRLQKALSAVYWPSGPYRSKPVPSKVYVDEGFFRGAYATVLFCHWLVIMDRKYSNGQQWATPFIELLTSFQNLSVSLVLCGTVDVKEGLWESQLRANASKWSHPALTEAVVIFCKSLLP